MYFCGVSFDKFLMPSKRNPNLPLNFSSTIASGFLATFPTIILTYTKATARVTITSNERRDE
jgi:hypothetical protein